MYKIETFLKHILMLSCLLCVTIVRSQDFNTPISKEEAQTIFESSNGMLSRTYNWGYTFVHTDSLLLKSKVNSFLPKGFELSSIYVTDKEDDPNNKGYIGYYAVNLKQIATTHTALTFFEQYNSFFEAAKNSEIALVGFEVVASSPQTIRLEQKVDSVNVTIPTHPTLRGRIFNSKTKQPIPNVNVSVLNENVKTLTNQDGRFSLKIPQRHLEKSLKIEITGYKDQKLKINEALKPHILAVFLEEDVKESKPTHTKTPK